MVKQLGLFDNKTYEIPRYTEGSDIFVYDEDYEWERYNGMMGIVVSAPIPYRGYDVLLENGEQRRFQGHEIMPARRVC